MQQTDILQQDKKWFLFLLLPKHLSSRCNEDFIATNNKNTIERNCTAKLFVVVINALNAMTT